MKQLLLTILVFATAETFVAADLRGRVVAVQDGDTVTLLDERNQQHRIRLQGIDAPEKSQPFGNVSRENLSGLVFDRDVLVQYEKLDRYGRVVGKILIDNRDACLAQVEAGLAWHYKQYQIEQTVEDRARYAAAEETARRKLAGLWRDPSPKAPWEFRHSRTVEIPVGAIIANRQSGLHHRPDCPDYQRVEAANRETFASSEDAEHADYRLAGNCP